jgi:hypothetical protein
MNFHLVLLLPTWKCLQLCCLGKIKDTSDIDTVQSL